MSMMVAAQAMATAVAAPRVRETTGPATRRPAALPALTGLRFVAAALVILLHFGQPSLLRLGAPRLLRQIAATGYVGVDVFFILSGFILALGYVQPDGRLRGGLRAFYAARVARVYPVYLLALLATVALAPSSLGAAVASAALLQAWLPGLALAANPPGWSLCAEALFYALFPLLIRPLAGLCGRRLLALAGALYIALLAPAVLYVALRSASPAADYGDPWLLALAFNPALRLPEFGLGLALARLFVLRQGRGPLAPSWLAGGALLGLLGALALSPSLPFALVQHGLFDPLCAAVIYGLASGRGALCRVLAARPVRALGEASYALYILQVPAWLALTGLLRVGDAQARAMPLLVAVFVGALLAVALLVLRLVEHPARRAIRRTLAGRAPAPCAPLGAARAPGARESSSTSSAQRRPSVQEGR